MSLRAISGCALLFVLITLAPSRAEAELPRPYGVTTGGAFEGGFGGNGTTSDDYADDYTPVDIDIRPLVGLFMAGYYRIIDYVSLGLLIHYGFLAADFNNADDDTSGFFSALFEVRGHLPIGRFDPWIGFGFGYAMTFAHGWGDFFGVDYDLRGSLHGVGLGVSLGLNIFITRQFALGPFFRMIFGIYPTACFTNASDPDDPDRDCDTVEDMYLDNEPDDYPHLWIVGLSATYMFD